MYAIRSYYALDVIAVLGSLYNGYLAVTHGLFLTLAFQLTFIILLAAGNRITSYNVCYTKLLRWRKAR